MNAEEKVRAIWDSEDQPAAELLRRNDMPSPIMKFFDFKHLPEHLQGVSGDVFALACSLDAQLPDGPEKSAGLRKLLEAKDCFVRAALK